MTGLLVAGCALLGLLIGSFLNVVIHRVPRKESVVRPPSRCPGCAIPLAARDNLLALSWLLPRGKCRTCSEPISPRYPAVELATAVLFGVVAARIGAHAALPAFLVVTAGLVAISAVDLELFIVPNRILYPTLFIAVPPAGRGSDRRRLVPGAYRSNRWRPGLRAAAGDSSHPPGGMGFGDVWPASSA